MGHKESDTTEQLNWTDITKDNWVFGHDVIFLCCIIYYQLGVIPNTRTHSTQHMVVLRAKIYSTSGGVWGNPCTGFLCFLPFPGGGHSEHDLFTSSNMHLCGVVVFLSRKVPLGLNGWVLVRTNHVDRLPSCSVVKNLPANAGDVGSVPVSGRSLVEENGNPLQYSCLENLMDRGVWLAGVAKLLDTT